MGSERFTICCSPAELVYLAQVLGGHTLLGVDDPFSVCPADEVAQAKVHARATLAARQFIEVQADGGVKMDVGVAGLISACVFPNASFVLDFTLMGGKRATRYLHVSPFLAVELSKQDEPAGYELVAMLDRAAFERRVSDLLHLGDQQAVAGVSPVRLHESVLMEASAMAMHKGPAAVQTRLQEAGVEAAGAAALAETLVCVVGNGSIVAITRDPPGPVAGVAILDGKNGMWRLESVDGQGTRWVIATTTNAQEIRRALERLTEQAFARFDRRVEPLISEVAWNE